MDHKNEYKKDTGKSPYVFDNKGQIVTSFSYSDSYVSWLHSKIQSKNKQQLIDFIKWYREDEMQEYSAEHLVDWF